MLDKIQIWICRTVGASIAASLEPLAHCQNVANLSLFYGYHFDGCSSELLQLVPLSYSWGWSIQGSDRLHYFSVTICRFYKDIHVNSPSTTRLWNSLPIEMLSFGLWFSSLELTGIFNWRFFLTKFPVYLNLFVFLFLITPCLVLAVQPCMEWIPIF